MSTHELATEYFSEVMARLMFALKIQKEGEVAALMGFKKDTFSARKKRGALPEDKIKLLCADRSINFNWVMTGKGEQTVQQACTYPAHTGVFPKELDTDLMLKVTDAIEETVKGKGRVIPKDKIAKLIMIAYADAFWRGRAINPEYIDQLVEVAAAPKSTITRERVFLEAATYGFIVCEQLPELSGWLGGIKVIEITGGKKDTGGELGNKILESLGIKPQRGSEISARQLNKALLKIYQEHGYRHIAIIINSAHLLTQQAIRSLKIIRENAQDIDNMPGFILVGTLKTMISEIESIEDIRQRAIVINDQEQFVGWPK